GRRGFGFEGGGPSLGLHDVGAAVLEARSVHLTPAEGDERDHGRLGTWNRAGQTLKTPEFTLRSGRLWYLADGAGRAYAAVNSHLVIAGPLHGALLTEWTDGRKGWRWVPHDLSAYKGHRLHVVFCPSGRGRRAIARVVDSEHEPAPFEPPNPVLARALAESAGHGPEALARSYQAVFAEVARRMEADQIVGQPDAPGLA